MAKEKGLEYILILEDDAVLVKGFKDKLQEVFRELPGDWDALWLNGTETKKWHSVSERLKRVRQMWGTFGYLVRAKFYDTLIEGLSKATTSADGYYTTIQKQHQVFATKIPLVKHRNGVSDIAGVVVSHYKHLE